MNTFLRVPPRLKRYYGHRHLHFITCSCYGRLPLLGTARRRDVVLQVLEEVRLKFRFTVVGYVAMPEHIHLLISEPQVGSPSTVMQLLKQTVARRVRAAKAAAHFWQRRFFDFNVFTESKRIEKLRYMHRNPVKRGLVTAPELWDWSSFRCYQYGERGAVALNETFETAVPTLRSA
jgi:REP-associated tyrosine transposase